MWGLWEDILGSSKLGLFNRRTPGNMGRSWQSDPNYDISLNSLSCHRTTISSGKAARERDGFKLIEGRRKRLRVVQRGNSVPGKGKKELKENERKAFSG